MNEAQKLLIVQAFVEQIAIEDDKLKQLSTEVLLERLPDPGDLDGDLMLLELFRRGALYRLIELYPDDKDNLIDQYNQHCLIGKLVAELPVPSMLIKRPRKAGV